MSDADRDRWNARYGAGEYAARTHPTVLLSTWLAKLPHGRALDIACGAGRNALFLADHGYQVDAVDIADVALQRASATAEAASLSVNWIARDLERETLPDGPYDLIVVSPTYSHLPWYADHAADPGLRQETYFLKDVVPLVERTYPALTNASGNRA